MVDEETEEKPEPINTAHFANLPQGHLYFIPVFRARYKASSGGHSGIALQVNPETQMVQVYWGVYYNVRVTWVPLSDVEIYIKWEEE